MDWLTAHKIPIGKGVEDLVNLLIDHAGWLFDAISTGLGFLIDGLIAIMQAVPPLALVALFAALAYWLHRSVGLVRHGRGLAAADHEPRLLERRPSRRWRW